MLGALPWLQAEGVGFISLCSTMCRGFRDSGLCALGSAGLCRLGVIELRTYFWGDDGLSKTEGSKLKRCGSSMGIPNIYIYTSHCKSAHAGISGLVYRVLGFREA